MTATTTGTPGNQRTDDMRLTTATTNATAGKKACSAFGSAKNSNSSSTERKTRSTRRRDLTRATQTCYTPQN